MRQSCSLAERVAFAENPEPRCPCVLLLDTSSSMAGRRLESLAAGLGTFLVDVAKDGIAVRRVELAIVTFDSSVHLLQDFASVDQIEPPDLRPGGHTHMGGGIRLALDLLEARKAVYRAHGISYYRPWVFMITDGQPEGEEESVVRRAASRLRQAEVAGRVAFFAVGVEGANIKRLAEISVRPPLELEGLEFDALFLWLSASMGTVSRSEHGDTVSLPPINWLKRVALFVERNEGAIRDVVATVRVVTRATLGG
jgi:uncharacterized protein YegL